MIIKSEEDSNQYLVTTNALGEWSYINFDQIMALKEVIDQLVSDEQSRLLQESFLGDADDCIGCKI